MSGPLITAVKHAPRTGVYLKGLASLKTGMEALVAISLPLPKQFNGVATNKTCSIMKNRYPFLIEYEAIFILN